MACSVDVMSKELKILRNVAFWPHEMSSVVKGNVVFLIDEIEPYHIPPFNRKCV